MVTMLVVYNTSCDFNDDHTMLLVHDSFALKPPRCQTTLKVLSIP